MSREVLFGISGSDPLTIAAVIALMFAVGGIATCMPVRRALRIDPTIALRHD
jgi:ABC-type antimicrobial peptide transport system permease subunit